jgi:hypothetical protein
MNRIFRQALKLLVVCLFLGTLICSTVYAMSAEQKAAGRCAAAERKCKEPCWEIIQEEGKKPRTGCKSSNCNICIAKCRVSESKCMRDYYASVRATGDENTKAVAKKRHLGINKCLDRQDRCNLKCNERFPTKAEYDQCSDGRCAKSFRVCRAKVYASNPMPEADANKDAALFDKGISRCRTKNTKAILACLAGYPEDNQQDDFNRCRTRAERMWEQCNEAAMAKVTDARNSRRISNIMAKRELGNAKCVRAESKCTASCYKKGGNRRPACIENCQNKKTHCIGKVARKFPLD